MTRVEELTQALGGSDRWKRAGQVCPKCGQIVGEDETILVTAFTDNWSHSRCGKAGS